MSSAMIVLSMTASKLLRFTIVGLCAISLFLAACKQKKQEQPDRPRLTPNVTMRDVTFHSAALKRDL